MTLRGRLTLFFVVIVVVPLIAGGVIILGLVSHEADRRTDTHLRATSGTVVALFRARAEEAMADVRVAARALAPAVTGGDASPPVRALRRDAGLDFLALTGRGGRIIASDARTPDLVSGTRPAISDLLGRSPPVPLAKAEVRVAGTGLGAQGGFYLDRRFLTDVARATGVDAVLMMDGAVLASSRTPAPSLPPTPRGTMVLPGGLRARVVPALGEDAGAVLAVVAPREQTIAALRGSFALLALLGVAMATALGYSLARLIAQPLQQLADGALAIAGGDLARRVEVSGRDDTARVAAAFNAMAETLQRTIEELRTSRDELRVVLKRLGATLRSTTDLDEMLSVILESAVVSLGARSGAIFLLAETGEELLLETATGLPPEGSSLRLREGVAGHVAATGIPLLTPSRWTHPPRPAGLEPAEETAMAVPLSRGDLTIGVLALYGRRDPEPFSEEDLATLTSFAGQTSVAIENVLLREEAERLSVTDALTGVGNRRHLQAVLEAEIERAQRFGRTFSVLLIDLDHFKRVNDTYGHGEGDRVLVELCRRLSRVVRVPVDTVARYGGEEFILVLPETPRSGAGVVAARVLDVVRSELFTVGSEQTRLTVSAGAAGFPEDGTTVDALVRTADRAMYEAKNEGRDCFRVSDVVPSAGTAS